MQIYVAYACNENYACQTAVSIGSLCEQNKGHAVSIYLLADGMRTGSLRRIRALVESFGQRITVIPMRPLFQGMDFHTDDRHPDTIYAKLFLPAVCHADRLLYLDSDTVVTASLAALFSMDMGNACIAGVRMPYSEQKKREAGLPPGSPYVCDGMLLMNLKAWRREHLTEKCMAYIKRCGGTPKQQSEGVVNHIADGRIQVLAPEYNLMSGMLLWSADQLASLYRVSDYYTERELAYAREHPVVIHYLDELFLRPWYARSDHPYRNVYQTYSQMTGFAACAGEMPGKLRIRTRVLRNLNAMLPFPVFLKLYHAVCGLKLNGSPRFTDRKKQIHKKGKAFRRNGRFIWITGKKRADRKKK